MHSVNFLIRWNTLFYFLSFLFLNPVEKYFTVQGIGILFGVTKTKLLLSKEVYSEGRQWLNFQNETLKKKKHKQERKESIRWLSQGEPLSGAHFLIINGCWGESVENEPSDYYLVHNTKCIALLGVSQSSNCCPKI